MISNVTTGMASAMTSGSTSSAVSPRLVSAAHEFEAQLMKELVKPLNQTNSLTGEDNDSDGGENSTLGAYATDSMARALSDHGGLGIANQIIHQLSKSGNMKTTKQ